MEQRTVQWRFERGDAAADEIQSTIDEILRELTDPASEALRAAQAAGIQSTDLDGLAIDVREERQGAEPVLTAILVGIAVQAGATVVESLWREVIWPRLRRRLGARVLGPRQDVAAPTD